MSDSEKIEYRGYTIKVSLDECVQEEGPRDWSNVGTMVCWHRRYKLGDEQPSCDPDEYQLGLIPGEVESVLLADTDYYDLPEAIEESPEIKDAVDRWFDENVVMLQLRLYDHSGISMSTGNSYPFNCPWDSGRVGFIYCTMEKALEELGGDEPSDVEARRKHGCESPEMKLRDRAVACLESEVEIYDHFISGQVYGYQCHDPDGDELDDGSCWGFYGYDHEKSGLLDYAHNAIDCEIAHRREQHANQLKAQIRGGAPLWAREPMPVGAT